jgi:hypothetical protein
MRWEVHFEENIEMIACLSRFCQSDIIDVIITNSTIIFLYHASHVMIDIIVGQREYLQMID